MTNHIGGITLHPETYPTKSHYPFSLPLFHHTRELHFTKPVTLFTGENGTGKSTLLEAMARAANVHIWHEEKGRPIKSNRYEKYLYRHISLHWKENPVPGSYFGSDIYNNFRNLVEAWGASDPGQLKYYGGKSLVTQSHGESIMSYFRSRYNIKGIYFLDEPETALSPKTQLELVDILNKSSASGDAQFFIATHSPIIMSCNNAEAYSFNTSPVSKIDYRDTEQYSIYRDFFKKQER
jgi:predicted ATPase